MARLLRLHLSCVGHKDARFFPLTLDFRDRFGHPTDCVVWLMNGGGKSSLMNLFYSTFQPESRRFLGTKAESGERKLSDYVKSSDLAVVLTEWQMPAGKDVFSPTRVVGQVLAWKGGVATSDETRLDREFFTFRGGDMVRFESLPFHGLGAQPLATLARVKDWLAQLSREFPELEVERGDQSRKAKWRETLDRVGIDTELFNYHLKMNAREGGAAGLFEVRDTMEFIDLFLEMAFNPDQADKTRDQMESVREKLLRLPQKELEERFALSLLDQLRPLAGEAAAARTAEAEFHARRRENFLLQSAIENWITATKARLTDASGELEILRQNHEDASKRKLHRQEHRLNYHNLARELTYREARDAVAAAHDLLEAALVERNLAAAGMRFARITSRQAQLDELVRAREAELANAKPVLDELHVLGAGYIASLGLDLDRIGVLEKAANSTLSEHIEAHLTAEVQLAALRDRRSRTEEKLEGVKRRLTQRDIRRAALRNERILQPEEKAAAAVVRWEGEQKNTEESIAALETRIQQIDEQLEAAAMQVRESESCRRERSKEVVEKDSAWKRGDAAAAKLRQSDPIREVLGTECADLEFPDLSSLLYARQRELADESIQGRLDRVDDERTLHSFELEHLFPPSREVELVLVHLRDCGLKTAQPAYRFLATNAKVDGTARNWLSSDPARYSGVILNSESEFASLAKGGFAVRGLRHPVQVTLSATPGLSASPNEITVALPTHDGAFNYESAAMELDVVRGRLEATTVGIEAIDAKQTETAETIRNLAQWRIEFGGGALERLATERDHILEEIAELANQITALNIQAHDLRSERDAKHITLKQLRPRIGLCIQCQERLRSYIDEYERHEGEWIAERHDKITLLEQLTGEISAQESDVKRLTEYVDSQKERVRALAAERQDRIGGQGAVRFRAASPPDDLATLEIARTRYQTAVARYDERFGHSQLEGQIHQAELFLRDLRKEHHQFSGGLPSEAIASAALHPDLAERQAVCDRRHLEAHSAHEAAVAALRKAERDRPGAPAHKQGLGLPPGEPVPSTATEAIACREKLDRLIEADDEEILSWKDKVAAKDRECTGLSTGISARTPHLTTLEDLTEQGDGPTAILPGDDLGLTEMVAEAKRATQRLRAAHEQARAVVTERIEELKRGSRRPEFAAIPEIARDRLATLPREELLQRCGEFVQSHEAWQKVLRDEIETLAKDKDLVVRALDGVATAAVRLLGRAERASLMPDSFPGWIGQPFLRITAQATAEPAARRDRLAALVSRLINERVLPTGHALASAALREIGGAIRATLLKPEDPLRPDRHDITEFKNFSGGEKMTAAVLLYATLAQLRCWGRNEQSRDRSAGVLLLDNPFGIASKREFVELQLRVARQMGVQLIYTTGVNDLGALDVLPRILRLRKHHRDRRSGDLLLSQEAIEQPLEGVQANLRP